MQIVKENSGFTIIEVLIAMMIFTIGVLAVAKMQVKSLYANKIAFEQTEASMWASNQAEVLTSLPYDAPELNPLTPNFPNFGPFPRGLNDRYQVSWTVTDNATTRSIIINVAWTEKGNPKSLNLSCLKSLSL